MHAIGASGGIGERDRATGPLDGLDDCVGQGGQRHRDPLAEGRTKPEVDATDGHDQSTHWTAPDQSSQADDLRKGESVG
jgi:hypothetical protein